MPTEQVIIEFISDTSQLTPAEDKLTNLGKIDQKSAAIFKATNDELKARSQALGGLTLSVTKEQAVVNKLVASMKNLSGESRKAVESLLKMSTSEIAAGFNEAAVSVDDYIRSLVEAEKTSGKTEKGSDNLRQRLRALTQQLAALKLEGKDNTAQFEAMAREAGAMKDAINDTGAEIKNFASDTRTLDNVVGTVQTLAGGFTLVQGASALFGDQSEALQETLLKVNAAMAITQGLQQISNALQKEGAVSLLLINIQQKVRNAQLVLENALTSESVIVRGLATVAQKALNAAMAANPIGLIITALATVIGAFAAYSSVVSGAAEKQAELNAALSSANDQLNAEIDGLRRFNERRISEMETAGARQSDIKRQNVKTEVLIENARAREIERLNAVIEKNRNSTEEKTFEVYRQAVKRKEELEDQSAEARLKIENETREGRKQVLLESLQDAVDIKQAEVDKLLSIGGKNTSRDFELRRQLAKAEAALEIKNAGENGAKISAIQQKLAKELHDINIEAREHEHKETLAELNSRLIQAQQLSKQINQRTSQTEIDAQKKIILTTAKFESEQEGLSQKERTAIRLKGIQEAADLQRDFDKKTIEDTLQDFISLNNAELSKVNLSEKEKLDFRIENIIAAAEIEVKQNEGVAAKIKEINAKRDADIKALRLQSIQETLQNELTAFEIEFAEENRKIERLLEGQDLLRSTTNKSDRKRISETLGIRRISLEEEKNLIDIQNQHVQDGINKQMQALRKAYRSNLISTEEYQRQTNKLVDDSVKAHQEAEDRKARATLKRQDEELAREKERVNQIIEVAGQVSSLIGNIFQGQSDQENRHLEDQRKKIEDLRQTGAITEKEAITRLKKVDAEEKKIRTEQARRDKALAIFNAIINTAEAVTKAIANPVMAGIVAALGAAQIALIASRPIPKFGKGKKNNYEGPGQIGETGAELLERNGQMYVTKKPTIVWLGKSDKVYNPKETRAILERATPSVNKVIFNGENGRGLTIDYERLGREIGKHTSTSLSIDGYKDFIKEQQSFTTYLNNRRGF